MMSIHNWYTSYVEHPLERMLSQYLLYLYIDFLTQQLIMLCVQEVWTVFCIDIILWKFDNTFLIYITSSIFLQWKASWRRRRRRRGGGRRRSRSDSKRERADRGGTPTRSTRIWEGIVSLENIIFQNSDWFLFRIILIRGKSWILNPHTKLW